MKMLSTTGHRFALLMVLSPLCFAQGQAAGASGPDALVSPELLKHAGLKTVWESDLPIKKGETLGQLVMLGNRIYAISSRNYVVSLDKDTGENVFSRTVAPEGIPIAGLVLYADTILCAGGSKLEELDIEKGERRRQFDVRFGITCPVARNSGFFYVAGTDNRVHVYTADKRVQIFEAAATNDSSITSVVADDNLVVFATEAGDVVGIAPDAPSRRLWQFKAAGAIAGQVVKEWMSLFFASADTNVYRVDIVGPPEKTRLVWKYQAAAVLKDAPRVTQEVVYQRVRGKGMTAIDRETGSRLWRVPGGVELLAESRGRAYVITDGEKLTVMDNTKGKRLHSVNFAGVTVYASNTGDDKFYVADKLGRIVCLQPAE